MAKNKTFLEQVWKPDGRKSKSKDGCVYLIFHICVASTITIIYLPFWVMGKIITSIFGLTGKGFLTAAKSVAQKQISNTINEVLEDGYFIFKLTELHNGYDYINEGDSVGIKQQTKTDNRILIYARGKKASESKIGESNSITLYEVVSYLRTNDYKLIGTMLDGRNVRFDIKGHGKNIATK